MEVPGRTTATHHHHTEYQETHLRRISWAAIFAGTLIMIVVMMILSLLGIGIGLTSFNPMEEARPFEGLGIGALIWWVLTYLISVFAGAYASANLTTLNYKMSGIYHGVITWSLYTFLSFWLLTTAVGVIISGVGTAVTRTLGVMGEGAAELVGAVDGEQIDTDRINRMIQNVLVEDPERRQQEFHIDVLAIIQDVYIVNGEIRTDVPRQELEQSIARHSTLARQDVTRAANVIEEEAQRLEQRWQQWRLEAERVAQEVSDAVGRAAIWAFVGLVFGALVAAFAGNLGKPDPIEVRQTQRTVR
jgi:hypothetical protein